MLSDQQIDRYSRQIILPEVGARGQERLLSASLAIVDAGGDAPLLLLYLAAAGVGRVTVHHALERRGWDQHARAANELNPDCRVELSSEDAILAASAPQAVLLAEGLAFTGAPIDRMCRRAGRPLIWNRCHGSLGCLGVSAPAAGSGCYECAVSTFDLTAADAQPPAGALVASVQAGEAIAWLLGVGTGLGESIVCIDAAEGSFTKVEARRQEACVACAGHEA